jgi:hypothetical protein
MQDPARSAEARPQSPDKPRWLADKEVTGPYMSGDMGKHGVEDD